jgi:peptidoglycan/LPS O-acetylase OafA/YrhL
MLHFPLQLTLVLASDALGVSRKVYYRSSVFIAVMTMTLVAAAVTYRYFELPVQRRARALLLHD